MDSIADIQRVLLVMVRALIVVPPDRSGKAQRSPSDMLCVLHPPAFLIIEVARPHPACYTPACIPAHGPASRQPALIYVCMEIDRQCLMLGKKRLSTS